MLQSKDCTTQAFGDEKALKSFFILQLHLSLDHSYDYFDEFPYYLVDEIYLDTDNTQKFYKLYVLFSLKPFAKPILENEVEFSGE